MRRGRGWRKAVPLGILAIVCLVPFAGATRLTAVAAGTPEGEPEVARSVYVGSSLCQACHPQAAADIASSGHSSLLADAATGSDLTGCESCHGPGGEHVGTTGRSPIGQTFDGAIGKEAEAVCGRCHLKDGGGSAGHSPGPNAKDWERGLHSRNGLSCLGCHKLHGGEEHSLARPAESTCTGCHQTLVSPDRAYTHRPVADGECTLCHQPHGSGTPYDLVGSIGDSCRSCHPVDAPGFAKAHSNYSMASSNCISCHNPHSADRENALIGKNQHTPFAARRCDLCHSKGAAGQPALVKQQQELCGTCHPESQIMPEKDADGNPTGHHVPVEQGLCTTCHNPHATDHPKHMKAKLDVVCYFCHSDIEEATLSSYQHAPVATGNCLLCHEGHTSSQEHLLNKGPIELCESCHATQGSFSHPVGNKGGEIIRNPNTGRMMVCASCHAVHGSEVSGILPQEETALCRTCHGK